jgi:hypothetical protein
MSTDLSRLWTPQLLSERTGLPLRTIVRLAFIDERQPTHETIYRLIECAAADQDYNRVTATLARRLEQAASIIRNEALLGEIANLFEALKLINPAISQRLGRAIALAKLGASKAQAA